METKKKTKSPFREWADSIVFAVFAAAFIRWLSFEAYTIPTPSMEKSLLVGDFLFVSKLHYGTRLPSTPLQVPLTHQTLPILGIKSYSELIQLPYFRFPGFSEVKQGDAVVFNYPADTLHKPVDLRTHYIKRCVATPGDVIEVRDWQVYVNNKAMANPVHMQNQYFLNTPKELDTQILDDAGVHSYSAFYTETFQDTLKANDQTGYLLETTPEAIDHVKKAMIGAKIELLRMKKEDKMPGMLFPKNAKFDWNWDNFGPITVPKKGASIVLDEKNIALYKTVIKRYDDNENVEITDQEVKINGQIQKNYTFKQDYYFMMGDNRHNSADGREWGFVPEDHIVGKATFVWMSWDSEAKKWYKKIRWSRLFSLVD